jgi:hypothetical protein
MQACHNFLERKSHGYWIQAARSRDPRGVIWHYDRNAVLIPAALVDDVVALASEQERLEGWIMEQVEQGAALLGLYPPNAENKARYEASKTGKAGQ